MEAPISITLEEAMKKILEFPVHRVGEDQQRLANLEQILKMAQAGAFQEVYFVGISEEQKITHLMERNPSATGIGGIRLLEAKAFHNWLND